MKTGDYHIMLGSGFKGRRLSSRIRAQNRKRRKKTFLVCTIGERSALSPTRIWSHRGCELGFSVCPARHGPTSGWDFSAKVGQHLRRMYCWAAVSTHSSQQQHGTSVAIAVVVLLHVLSLVLELPVASL